MQSLGAARIVRWLFQRPALRGLLSRASLGKEYLRTLALPLRGLDELAIVPPSGESRPVDWVCGGAMALRGDFVRACGGFDSGIFLYGEDEDICIEAHRRQLKVVVVDTVPVVHELGWATGRFDAALARHKFESLSYFIAKHHARSLRGWLMRALLPVHVYGVRRWVRMWWWST